MGEVGCPANGWTPRGKSVRRESSAPALRWYKKFNALSHLLFPNKMATHAVIRHTQQRHQDQHGDHCPRSAVG